MLLAAVLQARARGESVPGGGVPQLGAPPALVASSVSTEKCALPPPAARGVAAVQQREWS